MNESDVTPTTGASNPESRDAIRGKRTTRRSLIKTIGAGTVAVGLGTDVVGSAAAGVPTPRLHTDGKWLKDPSGNEVKLRGFATAALDFIAYSWYPFSVEEVLDRATDGQQGWHPNHLRLPCGKSGIEDYGGVEPFVEDVLRPAVDYLATQDVYAVIDYHLIRPYTQAATETYNAENEETLDPIDEVLRNFWSVVAPEFADDEHVIFELFNEPTRPGHYGNDEKAWKTWREAAQPWVDLVQEHAPATPLIIGSPRWTSVPHMAPEYPFDGDNLVYAGHIYPANGFPNSEGPDGNGPFDPIYGAPASEVPIWITEFGWDPEGGSVDQGTNSGFGTSFREWVESYENISWSAWCFDDTWAPTFFSSPGEGVGTPWELKDGPEQHGGFVKDWLAETRGEMIPESGIDDSQAPPMPSNLTATGTTGSSVDLSWDAATDSGGSGLDHYVVAVDGTDRKTVGAGTTTAAVGDIEAESGYEISVRAVDGAGNESEAATLSVAILSEIEGRVPTDPDGDGLYEDLNANGRVDSDDVVVFFDHKSDAAITDHAAAYDFNGNGRIDFDDVATLFDEL